MMVKDSEMGCPDGCTEGVMEVTEESEDLRFQTSVNA